MVSQQQKQKIIFKDVYKSFRHSFHLAGWERAYVKRIFGAMPSLKNGKFLDIGAGSGFMSIEAVKRGMYATGIDISPEAIKLCVKLAKAALKDQDEYKKIKFITGDAENLPFKDESFDRVSSIALLEHLANDGKAIKEMCRVTRKGGLITVCVPNTYERTPLILAILNKRNDKIVGHLRHYKAEELINQFKENGAKLVDLTYHSHLIMIVNWIINMIWSTPPELIDKLWWMNANIDYKQKNNSNSMNFTITLRKV